MAFGAQHVQTTKLHHLVMLHRDGFLGCLQGGRPGLFVLVGGVDGVQAGFLQGGHGNELSVTTQHDVSTTTSHVGGHGYRTLTSGHGDDGGFAGVLLSV